MNNKLAINRIAALKYIKNSHSNPYSSAIFKQSFTSLTTPSNHTKRPVSRYIIFASTVAITGIAAQSYRSIHINHTSSNNTNTTNNKNNNNNNEQYTLALTPSQLQQFTSDNTITLYQYSTCPFCNKVQAYLDYHQIPYNVVEVNPLTKSELKSWSDQYKKVPILVMNDIIYRDSKHIINQLEHTLNQYRTVPHDIDEDEQKWINWVDTEFIPLITPNLYKTWSNAVSAFDYINSNSALSGGMKLLNVYVGAAAMYMVAQKRLKNRYKDQDVNQLLVQACNQYASDAINRTTHYHNSRSSSPDIADLNLYGVLRATCYCSAYLKHLLLGSDSATSDAFKQWYTSMEQLAPKMTTANIIDHNTVDTKKYQVTPQTMAV